MIYQVMPDLTPIEYEGLKASISEVGVLVPVELDEDGNILDGHHRVRAWTELRAEGVDIAKYATLVRRGMTEEQKRNHARVLNVNRRHLNKEQRDSVMRDMRADGATYQEIAEAVGVGYATAYRATAEIELIQTDKLPGKDGKYRPATYARKPEPPPTMFDPGESAALEPKAADRTAKAEQQRKTGERRTERTERINTIAAGNEPLQVAARFPVLYADPPWQYEHARSESRAIENQYPTMTLDAICALPVGDIATPDAVLFLWTTSPKFVESMRVIDSWGFVYRTCMVWDKERIGMGYYFRQQHELLLVAARGELPVPLPTNRPPSVLRIKRSETHSEKPVEVYGMIEGMYPDFARVELFARSRREGWAQWGNQA